MITLMWSPIDERHAPMPRHARSTKNQRDTMMIAGIRKHLAGEAQIIISDRTFTPVSLVAFFEEHIEAMRAVASLEMQRSIAIDHEARLEKNIMAIFDSIDRFLRSRFGSSAAVLREFGLKPRKARKVRMETLARAVEKSRQTRKLRRTMGRRQRAKIKG